MFTLEVKQVGDALGVVFPEALLASLQVREGDFFHAAVTGSVVTLTLRASEFERQMSAADEIATRRGDALRLLAG